MPLDYVEVDCPYCGGAARQYDGDENATCQESGAIVDVPEE